MKTGKIPLLILALKRVKRWERSSKKPKQGHKWPWALVGGGGQPVITVNRPTTWSGGRKEGCEKKKERPV